MHSRANGIRQSDAGGHLRVLSLFMASRLTLASSSLCPPLRNTTPGTAAGTVRCSARTVSQAICAVLAGLASMPACGELPGHCVPAGYLQDTLSRALLHARPVKRTAKAEEKNCMGSTALHEFDSLTARPEASISIKCIAQGIALHKGWHASRPALTMLGLRRVPSSSTL